MAWIIITFAALYIAICFARASYDKQSYRCETVEKVPDDVSVCALGGWAEGLAGSDARSIMRTGESALQWLQMSTTHAAAATSKGSEGLNRDLTVRAVVVSIIVAALIGASYP